MFTKIFILTLTIAMTISAPTPNPEPHPAPAADPAPAPKPGIASLMYSSPVAVSYNAFSTVQTHPSASAVVVKSAPAVVPTIQAMPTVYTLQAQAAPAVEYPNYYFLINGAKAPLPQFQDSFVPMRTMFA